MNRQREFIGVRPIPSGDYSETLLSKRNSLVRSNVPEALAQVSAIRAEMRKIGSDAAALIDSVPAHHRQSVHNLISYLALRHRDLRPLQLNLASLGLSSLGRAESHVSENVDAVRRALLALEKHPDLHRTKPAASSTDLLVLHAQSLFGDPPEKRRTRIMVTMPTEAARDYRLVRELLRAGMDCMRINCAHDDAKLWRGMIKNLERAKRELNRSCQIAMDLAGPKLRTGALEPAAGVIKVKPTRDAYGRVTKQARVLLRAKATNHLLAGSAMSIPISSKCAARLKRGDILHFIDARNSRRSLKVTAVSAAGAWAEAAKTSYIVSGMLLRRNAGKRKGDVTAVGKLPLRENSIELNKGDFLIVTRDLRPGRAAVRDAKGMVVKPARIGCTLPETFKAVRRGEPIWLDDGKIGGRIESVSANRITVKITTARPGGEKLRADKGINLPDTSLPVSAITAKDLIDLKFVAKHADIVELSFANSADDVQRLQHELKHLGAKQIGIILKIESRRGFEALPSMLCTLLRSERCGVMIARGDLAVECGFERVAELQEEILWVCEAAHVPVVWATQVLEKLTKTGTLSRAEITDAAMGERAECVMLNKGPHVTEAVHVLDDIFRRMETHANKKRPMLRELALASRFIQRVHRRQIGSTTH
jgi:pyruvate kinase